MIHFPPQHSWFAEQGSHRYPVSASASTTHCSQSLHGLGLQKLFGSPPLLLEEELPELLELLEELELDDELLLELDDELPPPPPLLLLDELEDELELELELLLELEELEELDDELLLELDEELLLEDELDDELELLDEDELDELEELLLDDELEEEELELLDELELPHGSGFGSQQQVSGSQCEQGLQSVE